MKEYDVLILGGGTGGTSAAAAASRLGARTAVFNDGELGGLCILRGCMPTKTLLHAAHLAHEAEHHHTPGISRTKPAVDFRAVMQNKDAKVSRFKQAKIEGIDRHDYEVIDARAMFSGPDTVQAGGKEYRFIKGAVIATGSTVAIPPVSGLDPKRVLTSDGVMELTEQPASLIVVGTGAIGLELAQFFARIGTTVSLLSRRHVLCDQGSLVSKEIEAALQAEPNLTLYAPAQITQASHHDRSVSVDIQSEEGDKTLQADQILFATGRRADLEGLRLELAGVNVERGKIPVDADMRTSNPKIFVAGDASGYKQLLHVANWEGGIAGRNATTGGSEEVEQRLDMAAVFTDPPFAVVGMNEESAKAAGYEVITADVRFPETGRAITQDVRHGVATLIADRNSGEVLGAQLLGPRADDIIHTLGAIMYYRGTVQDMLAMPWYHPTVSEVLLSLARAVKSRGGS